MEDDKNKLIIPDKNLISNEDNEDKYTNKITEDVTWECKYTEEGHKLDNTNWRIYNKLFNPEGYDGLNHCYNK